MSGTPGIEDDLSRTSVQEDAQAHAHGYEQEDGDEDVQEDANV